MDTSKSTGYAPVNGLDLYYEVHGTGEPFVLIHGGILPSNITGPTLERLAETRQVIVPHMQGHGHTPDIDRPLCYETMADDVAALIEHLELGQVDLMGYSMGAGVALQTAIRYSGRVRRLVLVARAMQSDGYYPEVRESFKAMAGNATTVGGHLQASPLAEQYPEVDWVRLFTKTGEMVSQSYDWSEDVAALGTPTMLVYADADCIDPGHMAAFYKKLGGGQRDAGLDGSLRPVARLAILPDTTHYNVMDSTRVAELVLPFLGTAFTRL